MNRLRDILFILSLIFLALGAVSLLAAIWAGLWFFILALKLGGTFILLLFAAVAVDSLENA